jgi:hypothetical protein
MIKLFPKPLLAILPVLFALVIASCEKDSEKDSGETVLLSFGPTGASHGDTLRFIGLHLERVTEIQFAGENAVVTKADFKLQTPELIKLLVPDAAEKGKVTLKTTQGDIVSKTELNLGVMPTITDITGEARPAANITITGSYLNWVKSVTFPKDKVVTDFVSQTFEELVVKVPDSAETGPLVIVYSGTDSGFYETEDTVRVTLPKATGISPAILYHGENVTITGTDLDLVRKVYFTNEPTPVTSFVSQTATELVVTVPEKTLKGTIKLEAASGVQTVSTGELDVKLPKVTAIGPGPVKHLENITITGTDLQLVAKVYFTNASTPVTSFVSQSPTQLVVQVPGAAKSGTIKVEMASGLSTTSTAELQLILPSITSFAPNPIDPDTDLTITGTNLDLVTAVVIENVAPITTFVTHTSTQIVVTVPTGAANGLITLKVLNSTVTVLSSTILEITGAKPPPTISKKFYDDAVTSNWNGWTGDGWGGSRDYSNTSPVRAGTKSVKVEYVGGYGSPLQLGGANIALSGYSSLKFSIYSTPEAVGNKIRITLNGQNDVAGYYIDVTLGPAGEWTDFSIPLSTFSTTTLTELWFKEAQGKSYTVYVDEIGIN